MQKVISVIARFFDSVILIEYYFIKSTRITGFIRVIEIEIGKIPSYSSKCYPIAKDFIRRVDLNVFPITSYLRSYAAKSIVLSEF